MSWQRRSLVAALCAAAVFAAPSAARTAQDDSKPAAVDKPAAEEAGKQVSGKKAIEAALNKKVDAQLIQMPLMQMAKWVEQECGIQVEVDTRCLIDAGIDPDTLEINLDLRGVTLCSVLHHALRPLDLTYVIANDVLLIMTRDAAASALVVEIYPAADLARFRGPDGSVSGNSEHVCELITTTCSPTAWDAVGGSGTLSEFEGLLVVSQSQEIQSQVAGLLDAVRASIASQANGEFAPRLVRNPTADDSVVRAALETTLPLTAIQLPLRMLANELSQKAKVPVLIDDRVLVDAGIDPETVEFTAEIAPSSLHSVLTRVLGQHGLAYIVDREAIVITTQDRAASTLETNVYPVADLLTGERPTGEEPDDRGERLKDLLTNSVDTSTWDNVGGASHVELAAPWNLLVVSAPAATQRNVGEALDKLRDAKRRQAEANLAPGNAAATDDPIELRVFAMSGVTDANAETAEKIAELLRELVPEFGENASGNETGPYLRALPDRMVVRHRRSVLSKVETLLKQLETPQDRSATTASAATR